MVIKFTFLDHNVTDSPGEDFPSLGASILVGFEKVFVWLEIGEYVNAAAKSAPT